MGVCLDKSNQLVPAVYYYHLMRVVRHGAQGEHAHVLLKRLAAVDGEEDQIILDGVEDNASVTCSLDDVMNLAGVDFALFHVFFVRKDRI